MEDQTPLGGDEELRAQLSTADINDLPDSDFAYIESGGTKDSDGKTVPRDKRHFPIHDEAHVRNALAQAPKSPFGDKAMPKILAAAKKFGIDAQQNNSDSTETETREDDDGQRSNPALTKAAERRRKERHRAIALLPDIRYFDLKERVEIRTMNDAGEFRVEGSPIMYGAEYRVADPWGSFVERIHFGSATDLLARGIDCRLLLNHDGLPMARTARGDHKGTMSVWDTDPSLRFGADLEARQQLANDFYYAIQRGDLDQMSVGMIVGRDEWGEESGEETRDIFALSDLLDVSGVTYPASPTTSIEVAYRMAMRAPVETYARVRRWALDLKPGYALTGDDVRDFRTLLSGVEDADESRATARAGKKMASGAQDNVLGALGALHAALSGAGVDLSQLDPDHDGDIDTTDASAEPPVSVSADGAEGGSDAPESGVGADGFPSDQTRAAEPGEPIRWLANKVVNQTNLAAIIEAGERKHGEARKRAA